MISQNSLFQLFTLSLTAILLTVPAWGRDPGEAIRVCGTLSGLDGMDVVKGQGVTTQILRQAGIKLEWRNSAKACAEPGSGLIISGSITTPIGKSPGVMASASVYEGTHVVVFVDRLKKTFSPDQVATVLGHVLAHEIVHLLQGVDRHSEEGLMKAKWQAEDYAQMGRQPLAIPEGDLQLIREGKSWRKSLVAARRTPGQIE